jgi:tRNA threonylcarbamoyladenosine biosynthesis protein TsaB
VLLLALDTATSAIAVALHDGTRVLAERSTLDARRHTEHLAPSIEAVLAEAGAHRADVSDVAVGTGPGPFTGLRVGVVTAVTFGHARGIPVHGVCSLDALAHEAATTGSAGDAPELVVATDARRKEVYWARYAVAGGTARRLSDPAVDHPATVAAGLGGAPVVGRGPVLYPEALGPGREPLDVGAGWLAEVALARLAAGEPLTVEPLYLRRPDAQPAPARKPVLSERDR